MFKQSKRLSVALLGFTAVLGCLSFIFASQRQKINDLRAPAEFQTISQDIESKLSRKADFIPSGKSALDQLIAVAQHYRIPMGIEWVEQSSSLEIDVALPAREGGLTVRELLQAIVSRLPDYQMTVQNGIVHVAPPVFAVDADNFLNVQIDEFHIKKENLFDAKEQLRLLIDMTLHPEDYEEGYVGGHGGAPDDAFAKNDITFTGEDLTVREILDGLIKASGNALWVAQLDPDDFKTAAKSTAVKPARNSNQDEARPKYRWRFVPLVEKP
jgi:hypothetical protein